MGESLRRMQGNAHPVPVLRAPPLRAGDALSVVAPAGPLDRERVERGLRRLEDQGFRLKTYGELFDQRGYLAGNDAERAAQLNAALADPETQAVVAARGGYGCARLLDRVDYDLIRRRPKIVIGFSDLTALHAAIQVRTGLITFHSPNIQDGYGAPDGLSPLSRETLLRAVMAPPDGDVADVGYEIPLSSSARSGLRTVAPGVARGRLYGGNLAVYAGLVGTPYDIDLTDAILFLEDVGEAPYRVDRFFAQLKLSGKWERLAGVLLGQFTDCEPADGKPSLSLDQVVVDYLGDLGVPVLAGFPAGHTRDNATLPLGALVDIDATERRVRVAEAPVLT